MNLNDLKVIEKVAENFSNYEWYALSPENEYYKAVEFPVEAEENVNAFYSEISKRLAIVVGAYLSRFYYEEDKYTWDKKYYVVIISTKTSTISSINAIAFITDEDVENWNRKDNLFITNTWWKGEPKKNPISQLYDSVNREVNEIDDLYSEFLEEE